MLTDRAERLGVSVDRHWAGGERRKEPSLLVAVDGEIDPELIGKPIGVVTESRAAVEPQQRLAASGHPSPECCPGHRYAKVRGNSHVQRAHLLADRRGQCSQKGRG